MGAEEQSPELVLVAAPDEAARARAALPPPLWETFPPSWRPPAPPAPARAAPRRAPGALELAGKVAATVVAFLLVTHAGSTLHAIRSHLHSSGTTTVTPPAGGGYAAPNSVRFTISPDGRSVTGLTAHGCGPTILLPPIAISGNRFSLRTHVGSRHVAVHGEFTNGSAARVEVVVTAGACRSRTTGHAQLGL
jgi:hypothetical protein